MNNKHRKQRTQMQFRYVAALLIAGIGLSCSSKENDPQGDMNPFDTMSESANVNRDKLVVISDLHLGNDLSYSENVKHLPRLEQFLNEVRSSKTVSELIIGGDMFDEWYIPTRLNTYDGGTQADFIRKTVKANQRIFDVLNGIIKDNQVKVTYVPGNHDMGFTSEMIAIALPGVNQARDSQEKYAVGTYSPRPQIMVEHGHRYDFFCAMTPGANETEAPGSFMPPGYFFARIAANSFTDPTTPENATKVPVINRNENGSDEQKSKYIYYSLWKEVMEKVIYVKDDFSQPIITTNVGGFTKTYAINDILPRSGADNTIQMNLYNDLFTQAAWDARAKYNNVVAMTPINEAILGSFKTEYIDKQSNVQYFLKSKDVRIVVFGHTHIPKIQSYTNQDGKQCVYANSGTWEDLKSRDKNAPIDQDTTKMHFVVIAPVKEVANRMQVSLWQYRSGKHTLDSKEYVDF